jgi:hypothetical protein
MRPEETQWLRIPVQHGVASLRGALTGTYLNAATGWVFVHPLW